MQGWRQRSVRLALALVLGAAALAPAGPAAANDSSIVRTTGGLVRGTVSANVRDFLGIPFAAPPWAPCAGGRRGRPPPGQASGTRRASAARARRGPGPWSA